MLACFLCALSCTLATAQEFFLHKLNTTPLLPALERASKALPLRYRLIVVPGSGCSGMGEMAERYFAGLLHAQVLILQKPGINPYQQTAAEKCSPEFIQQDNLSDWQNQAQQAALYWLKQQPARPPLPLWLIGISEGAELLPQLAQNLPAVAGLVLIASSGLDPWEAGRLQAARLGQQRAWQNLATAVDDASLADSFVLQGRSLRYWRDLRHWPVAEPLWQSPWPILHAWGSADALIPPTAFERFRQRAQKRTAAYRARIFEQADHGLQTPEQDGLQWLWAQLENIHRQCTTVWQDHPAASTSWQQCLQPFFSSTEAIAASTTASIAETRADTLSK